MRKIIAILICAVLAAAVSCQKKDRAGGGGDEPVPGEVKVVSLTLDWEELPLYVDDTITLHATVLPDNATDKTVLWTSSNKSVADVDEGLVTAYKEGIAVITAKAGDIIASCMVTVTVNPVVPVKSVTLNKHETTIEVGSFEILSAVVSPDNASSPELSWTSSDEAVASVSDGVVTAIAEGTAKIFATADGKRDSCLVTVPHKYVPVDSVSLNKAEIYLEVGGSEKLLAEVHPGNADNPSVTWRSSDGGIATVQDGMVTAAAIGKAVITAEAEGKTAACTVYVREKVVSVSSVTLDKTSATLYVNETLSLTATVLPENATDKTLLWSSSDPAVAKVENGTVTALTGGVAVITAESRLGGIKATCSIEVREHILGGDVEDLIEIEPEIDGD